MENGLARREKLIHPTWKMDSPHGENGLARSAMWIIDSDRYKIFKLQIKAGSTVMSTCNILAT